MKDLSPPDEGTLLVPDRGAAADAARRNRERLDAASVQIGGVPLGELRRRFRSALWPRAAGYTAALGFRSVPREGDPLLVVTAHQPEPFHPGIWFKNFAAAGIASSSSGQALSVVLDTDVPEASPVPVPSLREGRPERIFWRLFQAPEGIPFEDLPALSEGELRALEGALRAAAPGAGPLAQAEAHLARLREGAAAGLSFAAAHARARRLREEEQGVRNLEAAFSGLLDEPAFFVFLREACGRAFAEAVNAALAAHRLERGIRNRANPFPDLVLEAEAWETPFWIRRGGGARRRLWVRGSGGLVRLADSEGDALVLEGRGPDPWEAAASLRARACAAGIRIRPRALATTLLLRLAGSDLFVHGLGGARYDAVTDRVIASAFGLDPPAFAVATATVPFPFPGGPPAIPARLRERLRRLRHNPHRVLAPDREVEAAGAEIARLGAARAETPAGRREAFERIRAVKARLAARLAAEIGPIESALAASEAGGEERRARRERGYPFFFFPDAALPPGLRAGGGAAGGI